MNEQRAERGRSLGHEVGGRLRRHAGFSVLFFGGSSRAPHSDSVHTEQREARNVQIATP